MFLNENKNVKKWGGADGQGRLQGWRHEADRWRPERWGKGKGGDEVRWQLEGARSFWEVS